MMRFRIYYKEEGGNLFPNLGHVNVVNPKQVYDLKLILFFIDHLHCLACENDLFMHLCL
jgi:hypothetical protein